MFAAVICAACLAVFFLTAKNEEKNVAVITLEGKIIQELPLDSDASFTVKGEYTNIITVENGSVFVSYTSCKNHICEKTGSISLTGQSIVCAPNKVVITIKGEGDIDAVTQ